MFKDLIDIVEECDSVVDANHRFNQIIRLIMPIISLVIFLRMLHKFRQELRNQIMLLSILWPIASLLMFIIMIYEVAIDGKDLFHS